MTVRSRSDGPDLFDHHLAALGHRDVPADGGDGSACRVSVSLQGEGEGGRYHSQKGVEAGLVARWSAGMRPGALVIPRRIWLQRAVVSGVDARLELRQKKMPHGVKRVCKVEIRRKGV